MTLSFSVSHPGSLHYWLSLQQQLDFLALLEAGGRAAAGAGLGSGLVRGGGALHAAAAGPALEAAGTAAGRLSQRDPADVELAGASRPLGDGPATGCADAHAIGAAGSVHAAAGGAGPVPCSLGQEVGRVSLAGGCVSGSPGRMSPWDTR